MNHELGISFRSEPKTISVVRETAQRYGMQIDMMGVYDDNGDLPSILPLYEAAINLPTDASTRLGVVGFAIPKHPAMVDIAGYMETLNTVLQDPHRVICGLVPGAWMDAIGLEEAMVQQMHEAVGSLRYLQKQEKDGYKGDYYNVQPGFILNYPTSPNIPILLGAWGKNMGALAGEVADEVKIGGSANPMMVEIMRDRLRVGADKVGRDVNDIGIVLGAVTIIDEDGKKAREIAKRKAALYIDVIGRKDPTVMHDFPEEINAIQIAMSRGDVEEAVRYLSDDLANRFIIAGTPDDVVQHTRRMFDAGASRVEFGTPHGLGDSAKDELRGVALLVEKVFPAFR